MFSPHLLYCFLSLSALHASHRLSGPVIVSNAVFSLSSSLFCTIYLLFCFQTVSQVLSRLRSTLLLPLVGFSFPLQPSHASFYMFYLLYLNTASYSFIPVSSFGIFLFLCGSSFFFFFNVVAFKTNAPERLNFGAVRWCMGSFLTCVT